MQYYLISGEASGDMHGANLIRSLKEKDPNAEFRVWGGDRMDWAGGNIVTHYREMAFMGFTEVIANLRTILGYIRKCKADLKATKPDVLVLIDYPGFNLRIAKYAKKIGIRVVYYISPQVWAWKASRVKKIRAYVDQMLVILPFEPAFYRQYELEVKFVGHPLLDIINRFEPEANFYEQHHLPDKALIAIIPGSRKQEIATMLPVMLKAVKPFTDYHPVIAAAPGIEYEFYQQLLPNKQSATIVQNANYSLMAYAKAGLITSGTASLEAALHELPEVVCYKGGWLSYWIARSLVNIHYISLVNLVLNREAIPELIQKDFNEERLKKELQVLLNDTKYRNQQVSDFKQLKKLLGEEGASERAADEILRGIYN